MWGSGGTRLLAGAVAAAAALAATVAAEAVTKSAMGWIYSLTKANTSVILGKYFANAEGDPEQTGGSSGGGGGSEDPLPGARVGGPAVSIAKQTLKGVKCILSAAKAEPLQSCGGGIGGGGCGGGDGGGGSGSRESSGGGGGGGGGNIGGGIGAETSNIISTSDDGAWREKLEAMVLPDKSDMCTRLLASALAGEVARLERALGGSAAAAAVAKCRDGAGRMAMLCTARPVTSTASMRASAPAGTEAPALAAGSNPKAAAVLVSVTTTAMPKEATD